MNKNDIVVDLRKYGQEVGDPQIKSVGPMVLDRMESCALETT